MRMTSLLAGPAVAIAIGLLAGSAQAAPAGNALDGLKADPAVASAVEKTHWRRHRYYSYDYYPRNYDYPRHRYHRHYGWWGHKHRWHRRHHWW